MKITPEILRALPAAQRARVARQIGLTPPPNEHRVFVYGTLLSGQHNAHVARCARRVAAWTRGTIYDLHCGFPAYTREGETKILGELLTVDDEGFAAMDRLEGYPRLYRREEIEVFTAHGSRLKAWVYIMNRLPEGATPIPSGSWRDREK